MKRIKTTGSLVLFILLGFAGVSSAVSMAKSSLTEEGDIVACCQELGK